MSQFFKILKADPLGDPYTPNMPGAKPTQSYWCQVEGQEKAVMVGKQVREDGAPALTPGQHIYGDLMYAKSQKGTEYWKYKSAKVPDGVQRPQDTAQSAPQGSYTPNVSDAMPGWFIPVAKQIDYLYTEMKKMDAEPKQEQLDIEPIQGSEPLDPETQKTLDDIFSKEQE